MDKKVIKLFESMIKDNIIISYALGGGIAVEYYVNPPATLDIDIFVIVSGRGLDFMSPVYRYLQKHGAKFVGQHLMFHGNRLDVLPAFGLTKEAVMYAEVVNIKETTLRIIKPDYLAAILYFVGRKKDEDRIKLMINKSLLTEKFTQLVRKYGGDV